MSEYIMSYISTNTELTINKAMFRALKRTPVPLSTALCFRTSAVSWERRSGVASARMGLSDAS